MSATDSETTPTGGWPPGPGDGSPGSPFDRVVEVVPGRRAVAVRHVPGTLEVFATHFPRFPVLPGVLILDELTRVAGLALDGQDGGGGRWRLVSARRVRFRHYVRPGDALELAVDVVHRAGGHARCSATASVTGRRVAGVAELLLESRAAR